MADSIDVKLRIMGQRDASVDRAIRDTQRELDGLEKRAEGAAPEAARPGSASANNPTNAVEDRASEQVRIIELALRREQALRQVSFREQMSFLERALVAARGNGEEEVRILERIKQAREQAQQAGLEFAGGLAAGLTATAAVLGLIGGRALQVSAQFEQMRAQLETVQGSAAAAAETFKRAVEFAAGTPFDVKGVVKATVQLEVYGQRSKEILPAVADLAAGMGKRLDDTSLVIGKALSGSLEGFESLRNEYGISSAELKKYGAVMANTGGISVKTSGDLEKAKKALLAIIQTRFGGAIERQSQTLQASFERVGDSIDILFARIGDDLAPAAKLASVTFSGLVNGISGMDEGVRGAVVAGGLLAGILIGVTGASLGTVVALQALSIQLERMAAGSAAASISARVLSGSLALLGRAGNTALAGLSWLVTTPLGLAITGLGVAAAALSAVFYQMEAASKRAGAAIAQNANTFQQASNTFRNYRDLLNRAGEASGAFVGTSRDIRETGSQIADAFKDIPAADLARELQKAGHDSATLKKELGEIGDQSDRTRGQLLPLLKVLDALERGQADVDLATGGINVFDPAGAKELETIFGKTGVTVEEVKARVAELQQEQKNLANSRQVVQGLLETWERFVTPLDESVAAAGRLNNFLKFTTAAGDIQSLQTGLGELQAHLSQTANEFAKLGISTDPGALRQRLLDPKIGDSERAAIESRLELLEEENKLEERIEQRRLKDMDSRFQRENLGRDVSLRQEIQHTANKLAVVTAGSDEELALLKQKADLEEQLRTKGAKRIEEAARSQAKSIVDSIDEIKNISGSRSADLVAGYDVVLERLGRLKQLYKDATPEVKKFIDEQIRDVQNNRAQAQLQVPKENLQALSQVVDQLQVGGRNSADQLAKVQQAIDVVTRVRRKSDVDAEGADKLLLDLGNRRLALEQQIAQQKEASAREIQGLVLSEQDREIAFLEQRLAAGENVESKLIEARKKRLELALEAVELERIAEEKSTGDSESAARKADLKRKAIIDEEVNRRLQGYQKETQGLAQHLNQRQALLDRSRANRAGGPQSPLQSFEEAFGQGNGFNFTGVEQSRFGQSVFSSTRKTPTVEQLRQKVVSEVKAREGPGQAQLADGPGSRVRPDGSKIYNTTISVDGQFGRLSDPEVNRLVDAVVNKLSRKVEQKRRTGPAPGQTFRE